MHVTYLEVVFWLCMHHFDFTHSVFGGVCVCVCVKLQALVYGIILPTTVIVDYTIGLKRPSANGQFFAGAHMAASL